jgi:hypothetical protein
MLMPARLMSVQLTQRKAPRQWSLTSVFFAAALAAATRLAMAAGEPILPQPEPQIDFTAFGPGVWTCATWLATPQQERDGGI